MKKLILVACVLAAQFAVASSGGSDIGSGDISAKCPENSKLLTTCVSSPQKGDSVVAAEMLSSVAICKNGKDYVMVLVDKQGASENGEVDLEARTGGVSYKGTSKDFDYELSYGLAMNPKAQTIGKFTMNLKEAHQKLSSSYICK
jgi:hypothetical protein